MSHARTNHEVEARRHSRSSGPRSGFGLAAAAVLVSHLTMVAPAIGQEAKPAVAPPSGRGEASGAKPETTASSDADRLPAEIESAYKGILAEEILSTVRFLASPRFEGREAGERGADVAVDYLVSRFQAAGLEAGSKEGFRQRFDLIRKTLAPEEELTFIRRTGGATASRKLALRTDWIPLSFSEVGTVEAPLVFAGYGIVAPEWKWDDYAALGPDGVRGKVVVVFRHEPDEEGTAGGAFFEGREMTLHASLRQKARVAVGRGAVGMIVVDDPAYHEVLTTPSSSLATWTILTDEERKLPKDDPKRPRGSPGIEGTHEPLGIAAAHVSQELLRWLEPDRDWKAFQKEIDSARRPKAFPIRDATVRMVHVYEVDRQPTANVLAILRGSDPALSKEYVLIGGHYDHEGKHPKTGEIYPGADDNASGTGAVLAVAEAFAALPKRPARSLMFAAWGAEEKGLLGSAYFVRKPTVPLEAIVAGVNLDMVGRNKESEMSIVGRAEMPDFAALFDRFAHTVGFSLNDDAGAGAGRSDNGSLWLGGVPTLSLFSGTHEDYHEPEDTADKVVPGKVEKTARLVFLVAHEVAEGRMTPARLDVPTGPWKPIAPAKAASAAANGVGAGAGGKPTAARGAGQAVGAKPPGSAGGAGAATDARPPAADGPSRGERKDKEE